MSWGHARIKLCCVTHLHANEPCTHLLRFRMWSDGSKLRLQNGVFFTPFQFQAFVPGNSSLSKFVLSHAGVCMRRLRYSWNSTSSQICATVREPPFCCSHLSPANPRKSHACYLPRVSIDSRIADAQIPIQATVRSLRDLTPCLLRSRSLIFRLASRIPSSLY